MSLGFEHWKNATNGLVVVKKTDERNRFTGAESVRPGGTLVLTTEERRAIEARCVDESCNIFRNGVLMLTSSDSDVAEELGENPNVFTSDEFQGFFKLHHKSFDKRLGEISNVILIDRLLEAAEAGESGATVLQVKKLKARREELEPSLSERETVPQGGPVRRVQGTRSVVRS